MPFKGQVQPCHYVRFVFSAADEWDEGACTSELPSGQPGVFYRTYGDSDGWTETLEVGSGSRSGSGSGSGFRSRLDLGYS